MLSLNTKIKIKTKKGRAPSKRGGGVLFGPDVTRKFLEKNKLSLVIRSHEVQEEGYKMHHNNKLITIFSAPNYVDQMGNKAAFIVLDSNYKPHFKQFNAVKHPDLKPMVIYYSFHFFVLFFVFLGKRKTIFDTQKKTLKTKTKTKTKTKKGIWQSNEYDGLYVMLELFFCLFFLFFC